MAINKWGGLLMPWLPLPPILIFTAFLRTSLYNIHTHAPLHAHTFTPMCPYRGWMEGLQSGGEVTGGSASTGFGLSGLQWVWTSPWLVRRCCSRPGPCWGRWPLFGLLVPCHFMGHPLVASSTFTCWFILGRPTYAWQSHHCNFCCYCF